MTTEEKAKTIEIPFGASDSELCGWEYTIPEGMEAEIKDGKVIVRKKESEDERIRKMLVEQMERWKKCAEDNNVEQDVKDASAAIAYLEKQKAQKPNYCHHEVDETDWTEEYRKAYYDGWNNCNMQHSQLQAEQKPAEWALPKDFEEAVYKVANFISPFDSQEELRRVSHCFAEQLLSLAKKELNKPAEWSKEDEMNLYNIIEAIKYTFDVSEGSSGSHLITWLKFHLRPQPHWKPSEEQMEWLESAVRLSTNKPHIHGIIISLYEQLKRL